MNVLTPEDHQEPIALIEKADAVIQCFPEGIRLPLHLLITKLIALGAIDPISICRYLHPRESYPSEIRTFRTILQGIAGLYLTVIDSTSTSHFSLHIPSLYPESSYTCHFKSGMLGYIQDRLLSRRALEDWMYRGIASPISEFEFDKDFRLLKSTHIYGIPRFHQRGWFVHTVSSSFYREPMPPVNAIAYTMELLDFLTDTMNLDIYKKAIRDSSKGPSIALSTTF